MQCYVIECPLITTTTDIKKEETMEIIAILLILLVAFNIIAFLWAVDSRDGVESSQWELRQRWPASY
jgi:EamA domain-containing membrane protein RarD